MNRLRGAILAFVLALGCEDSSTGPATLHRIELRFPASLTPFLVNDTIQLVVVGRDQSDVPYPAGPVTWRSRNLAVIAVDSAGRAVGVSVGSATIVATVGRFSDSVTFDVAGTRHRFAITANETWTLAGSPHVVKGQLSVGGPSGATLTIEAGATVQFTDSSGLTFGLIDRGALRAQGTPSAQITLRGTATGLLGAGAWIGLTFRGRNTSELHHVNVSGCGRARFDDQPPGCLVLGHRFPGPSPTILIDNVLIENAAGGAVILQDQSSFAPGSAGLAVRNMHGHIATLPAGEATRFPLTAYAGIDTSEVRLTRGTVRESGTWGAFIPWTVLDPVLIEGPLQPVLTIPAGVTIPFGYGAGFVVGKNAPGGLRIGTEGGASVNLRPRAGAGTWGSVAFYAASPSSSILNTTMENCGVYSETSGCIALIGNFYGVAAAPVVKNVTIRGAVGIAVTAVGGGGFGAGSANLTITGTQGNLGAPFSLWQSSPASIPSGTYTGNAQDIVYISSVDITQSETWHNRGIPYLLNGGLSVGHAVNPTLTLEPGVELRFAPGGILVVGWLAGGGLRAVGADSAPIVFTGQYDHAGSWMGAMVGPYADTTTVFDHVILDKGGADDGQFATGFRLTRDMGPFIRHTTVRQSAGCGITRLNGTTWSTDFTAPALGNTFQDNMGPDQCGP